MLFPAKYTEGYEVNDHRPAKKKPHLRQNVQETLTLCYDEPNAINYRCEW